MNKSKGVAHEQFYLVPPAIIDQWRKETALQAIDRPQDLNLARQSEKLADVIASTKDGKEKGDDERKEAEDRDVYRLLAQELGRFMKYRRIREKSTGDRVHPSVHSMSNEKDANDETEKKVGENKYTVEHIMSKIPATYRKKAGRILETWTGHPKGVTYDRSTGEIALGGRTIEGSNIVTVLNHALSRARTARKRPMGFREIKDFSSTIINDTVFNNPVWRKDTYSDTDANIESAGGLTLSDRWVSFDDSR